MTFNDFILLIGLLLTLTANVIMFHMILALQKAVDHLDVELDRLKRHTDPLSFLDGLKDDGH